MVYTYLSLVYCHFNLDATKSVCWQVLFSAVPAVFLIWMIKFDVDVSK